MGNVKSEKKDSALSNYKLIRTTNGSVRVSQACDRCRIKKIKCDGQTPCHNCSKINFDCKTSDKLTRRAFPKGYTENLEHKLKELEKELQMMKDKYESSSSLSNQMSQTISNHNSSMYQTEPITNSLPSTGNQTPSKHPHEPIILNNNTTHTAVQINNPIDQIFNVDNKGVIIGNDNLNFESQFNHLLINLDLPFLKITNSHNYLLNDPNSYLYHPSYSNYNQFHNRDLNVIYNPITASNTKHDLAGKMVLSNSQLPIDIYDLFIKLINNFKKMFSSKKELDCQVIQFFLNYNILIPIFDYKSFMESYDAFHTMYPFMFTYDDSTINGFNISNNDYGIVNEYFMVIVQIYAMIMMNDPTINLNLLLNHNEPKYVLSRKPTSIIQSLYDFLPYFNVFHVSVNQLQTYLIFLYYSLLTNNKEKSLVLLSIINSFIGILGINLNSKNLFFNDLTLSLSQRRVRVKIFWVFKVLLKVFNLKFGFKPSINTTVINPVTIERYFELTPDKLSSLLDGTSNDELFNVLLKPSIEFLNLVNIIIPSSFSPNYYQYLKSTNHQEKVKKPHPKQLDSILNDDDGDGNDGNLNYNFTQFQVIDQNLTKWRATLIEKELNLIPLQLHMNLPVLSSKSKNNLFHSNPTGNFKDEISPQALDSFFNTGLPDIFTASQLIKIQLNFHYLLIRSMNYLNFVIDKELTSSYYKKIQEISKEVLSYFLLVFQHVGHSKFVIDPSDSMSPISNPVMQSLGIDMDEDGFVINDFSVKRRKVSNTTTSSHSNPKKSSMGNNYFELPASPFNSFLNGLSLTIINFKKSIILQMLYLLICSLRIHKKGGIIEESTRDLLNNSVDLFIKTYINYNPAVSLRHADSKRSSKENRLYKKLINDELIEELLKEPKKNGQDSDSEDSDGESDNETEDQIDWDDEEMDEDLKYLKILKFIKYKINAIYITSGFPNKEKDSTHFPVIHKPEIVQQRRISDLVFNTGTHPLRPPSLTTINNMYSTSSPFPTTLTTMGGMSKIPSLTKLDFLLGEDSYPTHTTNITPPLAHNSNHYNTSSVDKVKDSHTKDNKLEDIELVKKERLAVNDLMSLKNHSSQRSENSNNLKNSHSMQSSTQAMAYPNSWNYSEERKN